MILSAVKSAVDAVIVLLFLFGFFLFMSYLSALRTIIILISCKVTL